MVIAAVCGLLILLTGVLRVLGRGWPAMAVLALAMIGGFLGTWNVAGGVLDNVDQVSALDRELDGAGVPADAVIYWADQRPDARLEFYFGRRSAHLVDPAELVTRWTDRTSLDSKMAMFAVVMERMKEGFAGSQPFYMLVNRRRLSLIEQNGGAAANARVLCTAGTGTAPDDHDWIVFTNRRS
jgi:hypothetical protein